MREPGRDRKNSDQNSRAGCAILTSGESSLKGTLGGEPSIQLNEMAEAGV
jgi:hypothetical protein